MKYKETNKSLLIGNTIYSIGDVLVVDPSKLQSKWDHGVARWASYSDNKITGFIVIPPNDGYYHNPSELILTEFDNVFTFKPDQIFTYFKHKHILFAENFIKAWNSVKKQN